MTHVSEITENHIPMYKVPIVALGFATVAMSWAIFNTSVSVILEDDYGINLLFVGFIMTWDNIIAFFLQPYIGSYSDRTNTRIGRRMPFIIPGIIFGAIFFFLLSITKGQIILIFLINIVIFNLFMALYRAPAVSLLPDLIKSEDRSVGNGIVNLLGGVAAGIALVVAGGLFKDGNTKGAFGFVSVAMLICLVILVLFIREPKYDKMETAEVQEDSIFRQLKDEFHRIRKLEDSSLKFMLLAILTWFMAWNAIEAFYSVYVRRTYLPDIDSDEAIGQASEVLAVFPIVFVLFTIVGGVLGGKIGRIKTMKIGLFLMLIGLFLAYFVEEDNFLGQEMSWKTSFALIFMIAAVGWGLVNVNSIVVVWEHSPDNGIATGMYYAFSSLAAILGPTIAGVLMNFETRALFPFSITFIIISFIMLLKVKTGEAGQKSTLLTGKAIGEMID
jgi:Na+/melibiose symporter-like transporter